MSKPNKPKNIVKIYYKFPLHRSDAAPGQFTLDQVKKWASPRPLRRPQPRKEP